MHEASAKGTKLVCVVHLALAAQVACTRANPAYRPWLVSPDAEDDTSTVVVGMDAAVPFDAAPDHAIADLPPPIPDLAPPPPDLPGVQPTGLVSRWRFDEGAGEEAIDDRGANPGTLHNGVGRVTETFPGASFPNLGAASFDGLDDYIDLGVATLPAMEAMKSVSLWCRPSVVVTNGRRNVLAFNNRGARESLQIGLEDGLAAVWEWGSAPSTFIAEDRLEPRWHHLVYVYDGTAQRLYVDGGLVATRRAAPPTAPVGGAHLGTFDPLEDRSELWSGLIDDVRIYDHGLTDAEISWLAAGGD